MRSPIRRNKGLQALVDKRTSSGNLEVLDMMYGADHFIIMPTARSAPVDTFVTAFHMGADLVNTARARKCLVYTLTVYLDNGHKFPDAVDTFFFAKNVKEVRERLENLLADK